MGKSSPRVFPRGWLPEAVAGAREERFGPERAATAQERAGGERRTARARGEAPYRSPDEALRCCCGCGMTVCRRSSLASIRNQLLAKSPAPTPSAEGGRD